MQTAVVEKTAILTFEQHLADACNKETIGESNSLLLTSLITMDPNGSLRRPPQMILDTLQQYNTHYKIGHLLCRSRYVRICRVYRLKLQGVPSGLIPRLG